MICYKRPKGGSFVVLPTDFSKPFICFSHDLFNAKLHVYGFDMALVKLIFTYVHGRKQRVKKKKKINTANGRKFCLVFFKFSFQGFPHSSKEWGKGIRNSAGGIFLLGGGNLRRNDFDQLNLFQN